MDRRTLRRGQHQPPKDKWAAYRTRCVSQGKCPRCGKAAETLALCESCREKHNAANRAAYHRRKDQGARDEVLQAASGINELEPEMVCRAVVSRTRTAEEAEALWEWTYTLTVYVAMLTLLLDGRIEATVKDGELLWRAKRKED